MLKQEKNDHIQIHMYNNNETFVFITSIHV